MQESEQMWVRRASDSREGNMQKGGMYRNGPRTTTEAQPASREWRRERPSERGETIKDRGTLGSGRGKIGLRWEEIDAITRMRENQKTR